MDLAKFPKRNYVPCNTPLEQVKNFTAALDGPEIYIKRDDLLPGASGGNKTRKLDYCIADALEKGADMLITCGAVQSNHCRLTLAWANTEGLKCRLIMEERVPGSYKVNASGNNFLFHLLGVDKIYPVPGGTDMLAAMEKEARQARSEGFTPYIIPGGASDSIGAKGYVSCAQELLMQFDAMNLHPDHIVVPSGSGGTHAGIAYGIYGMGSAIPVSGINVSRPKDIQEKLIYSLVEKLAQDFRADITMKPEQIVCYDEYYGEGYSLPTDEMVEAVTLLARTESILLDPVYSGKAMAGLIGLIRKGVFKKGQQVVFLHTGGSPALYAYQDYFSVAG